ncbi:molybdopterin oxidoreductase family protein [Streptomyces sp. NPDC059374]|uniref:molybdopterin oxidoreductase family protein n=1 Tax=Streptomyces sp. NPDC059374 TaxID=3346814 RepID=UPI0036B2FED2
MRAEVDRIAEPWGDRTPYGPGTPWPVRVDSYLEPGVTAADVDAWVPTASVLHSNGDALDVAVAGGRIVGVRGSARDRVNHGRLGPKDLFGWQANRSEDRLTTPLVRRDGRLVPCDWDTALARIVDRSKALLETYGPGSMGFYTSGQLFLEEYYTLAVIARAGIGTNHIDGNTRMCTATAAEALKETFGCDGQPASYTDVDHADVLALFGHNMAETQPVLWMRVLDRLAGGDPPRLVCVDPRPTQAARHATVHLAPRAGTNVALLNALLHEIIRTDRIDRAFIDAHTVGFDELSERVAGCTPRWAAGICDVPAAAVTEAAEVLGDARRLLSTVLQGVYQSHQATAAAVQVNNLQLIFRYAEQGSIRMLWISGTNPAVSLPELERVRGILRRDGLFTVVQDLYLTETARFADVVLPAATWAEKTGTLTNADRTVHLCERAVEPPGDARSDLDIWLEYARWMDFRDQDGRPLVGWHDPESAFEAWKECSRGRPCDYTGLTYERLRTTGGIQWPCTDEAPEGTERLYTDGVGWAAPDDCETYGRDLVTGASVSETEYRALNPHGRAVLKAAEHLPPHEPTNDEYPLQLTTGRTLYHFHTRTKTGRSPQLQAAAPEVWVEISAAEARRHQVAEGDLVEVTSPRGSVRGRLRVTAIRDGLVFLPFHYGYWDTPGGDGPGEDGGRAANETTVTDWDPVSKQPLFKTSAARLTLVERAHGAVSPAPTTTASAPVDPGAAPTTTASAPVDPGAAPPTTGGPAAMARHTAGARGGER